MVLLYTEVVQDSDYQQHKARFRALARNHAYSRCEDVYVYIYMYIDLLF